MIYIFTGHLGSGKTLGAITMAYEDYLRQGKRVASNMTLHLEHGLPAKSRATCTKLPYIPSAQHLDELGKGYEGEYDESKFGLVLLDEAGSWLNSRDWSDKERRGLFTWITHARKHGWDVALIVQDFEALDAQIRRSICEGYVSCSRLDRIKVPYLPLKLPRMHVATARYKGPAGPIMKRWIARGTGMFKAYDTRESVRPEVAWTESGPVDMRCSASLLSAWHLKGRYLKAVPPLWARLAWLFVQVVMVPPLKLVAALQGPPGPSPA